MDFRYLIVQAIALMYWESQLPESGIDSRDLVKEIIKAVPSPDSIAGTEEDRENLITLRDIASRMSVGNEQYTREQLVSKLKLNIKKDPELREDVIEVLHEIDNNEEIVLEKVKYLNNELRTFFYQKDFKDEIKRIAGKTIFQGAPEFNVADMARQIIAGMERFVTAITQDEEDPSLNGKGDSSNLEEIAKLFTDVQDDLAPESVIKTGWQAFNRMCGEVGGLRRGNMYVIGALPNKGKSLITSYLTLHTMLYNPNPYMFDPTKKPCVVHISTENDLALNMKIWFRYLWENVKNEPCDISSMDPAFMASWFQEQIEQHGYTFKFFHVNPTNIDYRNIISKLLEIESEGFEIHLCAIDYLAMINGDGLGDENRAFWIRQLFKVMRNHCNPRKITLLTPHQVATDAAMYIRQGTDDFVKQIAGKRFWADCRSIDMEVDMEILLNVEKSGTGRDSQAYMSFGRGKDRSSLSTPEEDKFFFLPFDRVGSLRPDIYGKDTSKRRINDNNVVVADAAWTGGDSASNEY